MAVEVDADDSGVAITPAPTTPAAPGTSTAAGGHAVQVLTVLTGLLSDHAVVKKAECGEEEDRDRGRRTVGSDGTFPQPRPQAVHGTRAALVILCRFAGDSTSDFVPTLSDVESVMLGTSSSFPVPSSPAGNTFESMYADASFGKLAFVTLVVEISMPGTSPSYTGGS